MNPVLKRILRIERHAQNLATRDKLHSHVDLLLHPRRPPFVRTLPFVESLSLSSAEESAEETATRQSLELVFGTGEIRSINSEQTHLEPVTQNFLALDQQTPLNPPQERALRASIELHPQTTSDANDSITMEAVTPSVTPVVPPLQAIPDACTGSSSLVSQKEPSPTAYAMPMVVDESDQEDMPSIDLDSDSDS